MSTDSSTDETHANDAKHAIDAPQGVAGKNVTRLVIVALLVTIVGISYVLGTYNQIDVRRGDVEVSWRALTSELAERYRVVEREIASGVDDQSTAMELGERFRLAVDRFRTTAQRAPQVEAAREIEDLIPQAGVQLASTETLEQSLTDFNADQARLGELIETPAGKVLGLVLILDDTRPFELASQEKAVPESSPQE